MVTISASAARDLWEAIRTTYKTEYERAEYVVKYMQGNDLCVKYSKSRYERLQVGLHTWNGLDVMVFLLVKNGGEKYVMWQV